MKKFLLYVLILALIISTTLLVYFFSTKREPTPSTVNIVFTTDNAYKNYLKVALKSAFLNKNPESKYNITIFAVDVDKQTEKEFKTFENKNFVINIKPLEISKLNDIGNFPVSNHVSRADLYKFFMPDLLPDYDKVLYLDSDIIILGDLLNLYNTNINRYYLAAVSKATADSKRYNLGQDFVLFQRWYNYNCGVMVLNLKKMRKDNIKEKLIESKNADMMRMLMTQTAFNEVIPIAKIKKLSPIYNFITYWTDTDFYMNDFRYIYRPYLDDINSYEQLKDSAVIVHFAGQNKPWCTMDIPYSDKWWEYAHMINPNWKLETCNFNNAD